MTFVGKVLVIVQVVLSICFMAFAGAVFAVHTNWRAKHEEVNKSLASVQKELKNTETTLQDDRNTTEQQLNVAKGRADQAEAAVTNLQNEKQALNTQLETARNERDTFRSVAETAQEEAQQRRAEALEQRDINVKLRATNDAQLAEIRAKDDQIFTLDVERKAMVQKHERLLAENAFLKVQARDHDLPTDPKEYRGKEAPPPNVEGVVQDTRKSEERGTDFVEITLGSDDGIAAGHELFVYRPEGEGKYLGKIRIVYVTPDRSVGTVIEPAKNGTIQRGDNVTTKLF